MKNIGVNTFLKHFQRFPPRMPPMVAHAPTLKFSTHRRHFYFRHISLQSTELKFQVYNKNAGIV